MAYKFCENYLVDLYDAIKNNNLDELKKLEHELSNQEECVACALVVCFICRSFLCSPYSFCSGF